MNPYEIAMLMEAANLELVGRPTNAAHGSIWIDEQGFPYLLFQRADRIGFAPGTAHEVLVYFYGPGTADIVEKLIDLGNSELGFNDRMSLMMQAVHEIGGIDTFVNDEDDVVLIMPSLENNPQKDDIVNELVDNGYEGVEMPFYRNAEQLQAAMSDADIDSEGPPSESDLGQPI